ncbi:hypothetical protein [Flectobacillus major]|uniref:hypothetical protein n=1 Tax=Flectobacillus major TaxID=103 RepID=UPI001182B44A|nr:hypothetical protein [Flectobacillus major]
MGKRIPVEWQGVSILKGEGEYGCIVSGNVVAIGSDNTTLSSDLNAQIQALYNSLNSPGSYTGTFGQAIEAMKTKAQELLDKIARGETPTKEDYKGYSSICKAIDKGLKAWKTQLDEQYGGANSDVPAIKQLYNDIAAVQADILKDVDCDGTGYCPALHQETDLFYASLEPPKMPIHIPDLGVFLLTKCNLELGKANASKLTKLLGDYNELKRPAPHPNLADVAAQLADNPAYIKSLELFDDNDRVWHFAQNKNLQNNISKPSYFPENANKLTDYLKNLDERKKRVLKDIAGIGADNNATLGDFDKLKQAYADWPDRYDVYYLGANGATCSFFVGECLYKSGLLTTQSKYLSALELRNSSLFAHINKKRRYCIF